MRKVLDALEVPTALISDVAPRKGTGRPHTFTPGLATRICERMAEGELVIDICSDDGFPSITTLHRWRSEFPAFREAYARAREEQALACAERAVRSGRAATGENFGAARVHFDADRWLAGKLDPKTFGDRQNLDVSGEIVHTTPEQRQARIAALQRRLGAPMIDGVATDAAD